MSARRLQMCLTVCNVLVKLYVPLILVDTGKRGQKQMFTHSETLRLHKLNSYNNKVAEKLM